MLTRSTYFTIPSDCIRNRTRRGHTHLRRCATSEWNACCRSPIPRSPRSWCSPPAATIAGAAGSDVQAGYTSGQVGVEQLLAAVPQARKLANLRGEQISNIGSQDMNDEVWIKLGTRINQILAMPDVSGVVITHGTDTIEETAFFLNLVVKSGKPVVLTASMRPSTALSADGPLNFYNAVGVAANKNAVNRGVMVVINDWIHGAGVSHEDEHHRRSDLHVSALRSARHRRIRRSPEWYRGPVGKNTTTSGFLDRQEHGPAARGRDHGDGKHGRRADRRSGGGGRERHRDRGRRQREHDAEGARRVGRTGKKRHRLPCARRASRPDRWDATSK